MREPSPPEPVATLLIGGRDASSLSAIEDALAPLAQRLVCLRSLEEVARHLADHDAAAIVFDLHGGLAELDSAVRLFSSPSGSRVPLVFVTDQMPSAEHIARASAHAVVDFLARPLNAELLRAKLRFVSESFLEVERMRREDRALRLHFDRVETRRSREAALSIDVGLALTRADSLREMLERCTDSMVRHLDAAFARIWTLNGEESVLELQASSGMYTHTDGGHARVPVGKFKIGRIAQEKKPHLTNDVQNDARVGDRDWAKREGLLSFAGYPLILEARVVGVMAMFARRPLERDTLELLGSVADSIALGIERKLADAELARALAELREHSERLEVLNRVGAMLAAELDPERLVQAVTDAATQLTRAGFGAFFYKVEDPAGGSSMRYAISGIPRHRFESFSMSGKTSIFAAISSGQGVVRLDDITRDPYFNQNTAYDGLFEADLPVRSYLAVAVVSRSGRVLGRLFFGHEQPGVFGERAEQIVLALAAQAAIAMDNAQLFQQAQRLISALERSNAELDQFAYVASHDLKAPLRGIANLSEWIEEDLDASMTPETRKNMELLRGRVKRLEALIDGILDYSRAGRKRSNAERIAVHRLLQETIELLAPMPPARIEVQPGLPTLESERVPLQQCFMNLIGNALKHAERSDPLVRVGAEDRGEVWEFFVSDNGAGIEPAYHERIWTIFQTLEPRDKLESTGIGLAVVRKIVESRGGRAWVESSAGHGATFRFTWPKRHTY